MAAIPGFYADALILLGGTVVAAPLFRRLGLGTVLGYLAAGVVIGPLTRLMRDPQEVLHVSELGVVMLLFVIGLELKPSRLWEMRFDIFGMGAAQVALTAVALTALGALVLDWPGQAVVAGCGFALSSTALVMQMLEERGETNRLHGRKAFSILLFQDLAIVPLLALLPLLGAHSAGGPGWGDTLAGVAAIAALVVAGRYLLNPLFHLIASTGAREAMIAAALLIVVGAAALMAAVGLSMALGAFLAGVLLADSTYRHELEADVEPFRGLFLAVFFIAIGMSLDIAAVAGQWMLIALIVPVSMLVKALAVYAGARLLSTPHDESVRMAAILAQHGEFAFVLVSAALALGLVDAGFASLMIAVVVATMALTPVAVRIGELLVRRPQGEEIEEDFAGAGGTVLMIGFSRLGQVASQTLLASGVDVTIIDNSPERIRNAARFGFRIYFGDGTRPDVLRAAGIDRASLVAVCTAKSQVTDAIVDAIQRGWPQKRLYVRAYDRAHALGLMGREVEFQIRETFESALVFGAKMLEGLGRSPEEAADVVDDTRRRDAARLAMQFNDGIQAGRHMMHTTPVQPEPLVAPRAGQPGRTRADGRRERPHEPAANPDRQPTETVE